MTLNVSAQLNVLLQLLQQMTLDRDLQGTMLAENLSASSAHAFVVDVYLPFLRTVFLAFKLFTGPLTNDILQIILKSF